MFRTVFVVNYHEGTILPPASQEAQAPVYSLGFFPNDSRKVCISVQVIQQVGRFVKSDKPHIVGI